MQAISLIFVLVVSATFTSFYIGLDEVCLFLIGRSKKTSKEKTLLTVLCQMTYIVVALSSFGAIWLLATYLCSTKLGSYIAVIVYTLFLALMSTNELYISPPSEVKSVRMAFKWGFTKGSVNNIIPNLYLKSVINIVYLIILVLAQIEDMQLTSFSENISYFCTLNKYGIVILFSVEKIIKSFGSERKRTKILTEAFAEQERKDDELSKERKALRKARRNQRRQKREERKKIKDNK